MNMEITTGLRFTVNLSNVDQAEVWEVVGVGGHWALIESGRYGRTNRLMSQMQDDIKNGRLIIQ